MVGRFGINLWDIAGVVGGCGGVGLVFGVIVPGCECLGQGTGGHMIDL